MLAAFLFSPSRRYCRRHFRRFVSFLVVFFSLFSNLFVCVQFKSCQSIFRFIQFLPRSLSVSLSCFMCHLLPQLSECTNKIPIVNRPLVLRGCAKFEDGGVVFIFNQQVCWCASLSCHIALTVWTNRENYDWHWHTRTNRLSLLRFLFLRTRPKRRRIGKPWISSDQKEKNRRFEKRFRSAFASFRFGDFFFFILVFFHSLKVLNVPLTCAHSAKGFQKFFFLLLISFHRIYLWRFVRCECFISRFVFLFFGADKMVLLSLLIFALFTRDIFFRCVQTCKRFSFVSL